MRARTGPDNTKKTERQIRNWWNGVPGVRPRNGNNARHEQGKNNESKKERQKENMDEWKIAQINK